MKKPIIGITCGDINGIGPEVIIKTLSDSRILEFCTPVVFGSNKVFNYYKKLLNNTNFNYQIIQGIQHINEQAVNMINILPEETTITPGEINEVGGKYAVSSLMEVCKYLKQGKVQAMITAPIHKQNVQSNDFAYTGHTPFLRDYFDVKDAVMIMCSEIMRIALLTEHIAIKEVNKFVTKENILSKIKTLESISAKDFNLPKPKIAVLALNPHASDKGLIGKEEEEHIIPAIQQANEQGVFAFGPYSADAFFARGQYQQFDIILAMYHDQGLIPFKATDIGRGVNFTANMPVVRVSPNHGTAFDIAGKNIADNTSMLNSLFFAIDILKNKKEYEEQRKNPLKKLSSSMRQSNNQDEIIKDNIV